VSVLTDGAVHPDTVVSGGRIQLQWSSSVVHVGLPFSSEIVTLPFQDAKIKRVNKASLLFISSLGGKVSDEIGVNTDILETRDYSDMMDKAPGIYTEIKDIQWPGDYNKSGSLRVIQDQPLPMTLAAVYPRMWTTGE